MTSYCDGRLEMVRALFGVLFIVYIFLQFNYSFFFVFFLTLQEDRNHLKKIAIQICDIKETFRAV